MILIIFLSAVSCKKEERPRPLVGNDRDENGCIGSAGYTWCESKDKCIRPWEEDCENLPRNITVEGGDEKAKEIALNHAKSTDNYRGYGNNLKIDTIKPSPCTGCYLIILSYDLINKTEATKASIKMTMDKWQVKGTVYSED